MKTLYFITQYPFKSILDYLSHFDRAYVNGDSWLTDLIGTSPASLNSIINSAKSNSFEKERRDLLYQTLDNQYSDLNIKFQNDHDIRSVNTFFITTAHQPNLFTGPAYFFYKIMSVISLTNQLNAFQAELKFIPCFIIGSEDHDFEELGHVNINSTTISLEKDRKIAFSKYPISDLEVVYQQLLNALIDNTHKSWLVDLIQESMRSQSTIGSFTRHLIHNIFGKHGLMILDLDDPAFKKSFIPIFKDELFNQSSSKLLKSVREQKKKYGLALQAEPRSINLFYHHQNGRIRIAQEAEKWQLTDGSLEWDREQLLKQLEDSPELFSPNVILRPLMQEWTIPGACYVGGAGELAYWSERREQFQHYGIHFPTLIRRDSWAIISRSHYQKLEKTGLNFIDFFQNEQNLIQLIIKEDQALNGFIQLLEEIEQRYETVIENAKLIDATTGDSIAAEVSRIKKSMENLAAKYRKGLKIKNELRINQALSVKEKLFPKQEWQERSESFIGILNLWGPDLIEEMILHSNPIDLNFKLLTS